MPSAADRRAVTGLRHRELQLDAVGALEQLEHCPTSPRSTRGSISLGRQLLSKNGWSGL